MYLRGRFGLGLDSINGREIEGCSRSSLIEERNDGIVRVNVDDDGGELVRLNENEWIDVCRCFCVDAIVGRANRGGDDDDDDVDELIESLLVLVLDRESVSICSCERSFICDQVWINGLGSVSQRIIDEDFFRSFFLRHGRFTGCLVPSHCLTKTLRIGEECFRELEFINECVGHGNESTIERNDWEMTGGGGGANCGRRKNGVDCLLWKVFVVKSFTDVQRWMNVDDDDDIFLLFLSFAFSREQQKYFE